MDKRGIPAPLYSLPGIKHPVDPKAAYNKVYGLQTSNSWILDSSTRYRGTCMFSVRNKRAIDWVSLDWVAVHRCTLNPTILVESLICEDRSGSVVHESLAGTTVCGVLRLMTVNTEAQIPNTA